jgi:hypothetical protein
MKVTKVERRKLIESILPQLAPAFVETKAKKTVMGTSLIGRNVVKDIGGETVQPGRLYTVDEVKKIPINHSMRLSDLIRQAKDFDDMTTKLAAYVVKHSKP